MEAGKQAIIVTKKYNMKPEEYQKMQDDWSRKLQQEQDRISRELQKEQDRVSREQNKL